MPTLKERLEQEIETILELEERLARPDVASDPLEFKRLSREYSQRQNRLAPARHYLDLLRQQEETRELLQEGDPEITAMAREEEARIERELETQRAGIEELLLPPDPHAGRGVIMEIRAGTGGEEAALFAGDLFRMYLRYIEVRGWRVEILNTTETELGGMKEVVFGVQGPDAHRFLRHEAGTHRVQRIPKTESGGRIHTSAVTVAVLPEVEEEETEIDEKDLRVDVFRASGAGGQHVNKTDSAVRMTHLPTGLVVSCQDERSQMKNRARALRILRARLAERQAAARHAEEAAQKKEQVGSGDRSGRVRTYNFPQGRLTDHRIGYTSHNLAEHLEGRIGDLLEALDRGHREKLMSAE